VALYTGNGEDLLDLHDRVRWALRRPQPGQPRSGQTSVWRDVFDRYRITHVVPRLYGDNPGYNTYFDLLLNPREWTLTTLGPAAAVFYRNDLDSAKARQYVAQHRFDFGEQAFQKKADEPPRRSAWPAPPSFSRRYLFAHRQNVCGEVQLAQHYRLHLQGSGAAEVPQFGAAVAHLGLLAAHRGLAEDADQPAGYLALKEFYDSTSTWVGWKTVPGCQRDRRVVTAGSVRLPRPTGRP
jgi:hypothetical protein